MHTDGQHTDGQDTAPPQAVVPADQPAPESAEETPRGRAGWRRPVAALALGLVVGGAVGVGAMVATSDPTQTDAYRALQQQLAGTKDDLEVALDGAATARQETARARSAATAQLADLSRREQEVAAREQAVTAVEQQIAANSIEEGTWTVGRDITPGTYRTSQPVIGRCYWQITRTGSNGDIVENDIVTGAYPTVQLGAGQDFTNRGCGTFVKQ